MYIVGLFIVTVGIAIAVKSDMGVSPASSIPYTITCITGLEMGLATMIFHTFLVLIQVIILRKKFKPISVLQIPVGVLFGLFTTFSNSVAANIITTPESIWLKLLMVLVSMVIIAIGLFFYVPANIMPLAVEGTAKTVSDITGKAFSTFKTLGDVLYVALSLVACVIVLHSPGSVGVGTVISAVGVGQTLGVLNKLFGKYRDRLIK